MPALAGPSLPEPLTETIDIARFLMSRYPSLCAPEQHRQEADDLLAKLHDIEYFPLSFAHAPQVVNHELDLCEQHIQKATSDRHKKALETKLVK